MFRVKMERIERGLMALSCGCWVLGAHLGVRGMGLRGVCGWRGLW